MLKTFFKENFLSFIIILLIFSIDRLSKIYILELLEIENSIDIYLTSYLNLYLIWNQGIAFGLLSFNENLIYNFITIVIAVINIVILTMILRNEGFKKYSLTVILGGSVGNFFDRMYYSAVPDFIDLHIENFHWFIFNIADIFITVGVICLIYNELFFQKTKND
jgi:signal peptidase II